MKAVAAVFATVALGKEHPKIEWKTNASPGQVNLKVEAPTAKGFNLYSAKSPKRDFREASWSTANDSLQQENGACEAVVDLPKEGYKAFYVEAEFESPIGGVYSKCTRVFVANPEGIFE